MKVFLAVEGPNDGGALGRSIATRDNDPDREGALQPLVRQAAANVEIVGQKVTMLKLSGITEPIAAIGRRARLSSELARYAGCDVMVFHQDVDGPVDGQADDAQAAWTAVFDSISEGAAVADREGEGLDPTAVVAAAPLRTIEAWLMADPDAVVAIAESDSADIGALSAAPEDLWGRQDDRTSDHPKPVLRRGAGGPRAKLKESHYRALAATLRPDVVAAKCPMSFAPCYRALQTVLV